MSENEETVIDEYCNDCQIIREKRNRPDVYHFEDRRGRMSSFDNLPAAQLYADVYVMIDGFREKNTGKQGVPPSVASASENIRMTYLAAQMSLTYAAQAFDVDESVVRDAVNQTHASAQKKHSHTTSDT
jgi:hypothetical protein